MVSSGGSSPGRANAQNGDRESIADIINGCFFEAPALSGHLSRLNGQLEAAHLADGFEPAHRDGYSRAFDPAELVVRACHHWDAGRWPGRNGRLVFAQSLYIACVLHQLEQLSLRIWDAGHEQAPERLQHLQRLLDALNAGGSTKGPAFVRDARWLIQTAQGPLTRGLRPYFINAGNVSRSFTGMDRVEVHRAGAVLAGGHLRSQLRHLSWQTGWAPDAARLVALTRSSNSMDLALLVRDLVPLLDAYVAACARHDSDERLRLSDAILQGLSADPELLLTRLDLLGPSTMIEDLFVDSRAAGGSPCTAMGDVHRESLARYSELVGRAADSLQQDSAAFDPAHAAYSPLGIVYGFCADLLSNMVLSALRTSTSPDLSIEDMFTSRGRLEEKRALAQEWERLPRGERERPPFEHSTGWAAPMHARITEALEARAARPSEPNASLRPAARIYVAPRGVTIDWRSGDILPHGIVSAQEHCVMSDVTRARTSGATALSADRVVADRAEGRFLACVHAEGAWFGLSKVPLTLFTSYGKDALITDVPPGAIDVLHRVCPELVVVLREDGNTKGSQAAE